MRKLWTTAALVLVMAAASPAFAQTTIPDYGARPNNPDAASRYAPAGYNRHVASRRNGAYAYEPAPEPAAPSARCTLSPANINYVPCTGHL